MLEQVFPDVISKLFGRSVISNENNISNIIGRFNSSIENKILIVCNELQSIDSTNHFNIVCLKSLITDRFCTIGSKFINIRSFNNASNFIFVSNNHLPIKIENSDRRYLILKCSDNANTNFSYFDDLSHRFDHPEFYDNFFGILRMKLR
jgi:hypothetical protein